MSYGPWIEYGPLLQSVQPAAYPAGWNWSGGFYNFPGATLTASAEVDKLFRLTGATVATVPYTNLDARACCLHHASERSTGSAFWTPATGCPPLARDSINGVVSAGTANLRRAKIIGHQPSWRHPVPGFGNPSYSVTVRFGAGHMERRAYDPGRPDEPYRYVPGLIKAQVPGWMSYVQTHPRTGTGEGHPQFEPVRVDAIARMETPRPQLNAAHVWTINARTRDRDAQGGSATPYSQLGSVEFACSTVPGSSSASVEFPSVGGGFGEWRHDWDFTSSRIEAGTDPGYDPAGGSAANELATFDLVTDFRWWVRMRLPVPPGEELEDPPLRWVRRDDGRGVGGGAHRAKGGTSLQSSLRWHGGYR